MCLSVGAAQDILLVGLQLRELVRPAPRAAAPLRSVSFSASALVLADGAEDLLLQLRLPHLRAHAGARAPLWQY